MVELVPFCPLYEDDLWHFSPMRAANNVNGVGKVGRTEVFALKEKALTEAQEAVTRKLVAELRDFDNVYFEVCAAGLGSMREKRGLTGTPEPNRGSRSCASANRAIGAALRGFDAVSATATVSQSIFPVTLPRSSRTTPALKGGVNGGPAGGGAVDLA